MDHFWCILCNLWTPCLRTGCKQPRKTLMVISFFPKNYVYQASKTKKKSNVRNRLYNWPLKMKMCLFLVFWKITKTIEKIYFLIQGDKNLREAKIQAQQNKQKSWRNCYDFCDFYAIKKTSISYHHPWKTSTKMLKKRTSP